MFAYASSFNQDLSWNTSNVTNMEGMFYNAYSFNGNITNWDLYNVENMNTMLFGAKEFDQDISGWVLNKIRNLKYTFCFTKCDNIPIDKWDLTNLESIDSIITGNNFSAQQYSNFLIDLSKNPTLPNDLSLNVMGNIRIDDASTNAAYNYLTSINGKNMYIVDGGAYSDASLNKLDNSGNSDVYFLDNYNNNSIITINNNNNIYLLDSGGIKNKYENNLDLSYTLDLSNVTKVNITGYVSLDYSNGDKLKIYKNFIDPNNIIYDTSDTFNNPDNETLNIESYEDKLIITFSSLELFNSFGFNLIVKPSLLTDANIQQAVNDWILDPVDTENTYGHISNWNTSQVTNMSNLFFNRTTFNDDISKWNTSNVTTMKLMFCETHNFNQDLSEWNVSNVTTMLQMFNNATSFNQNINSWDISNVTNMTKIFKGAISFNQDWLNEKNIDLWREKLNQLLPTEFYTNGENYSSNSAATDLNAYPKINP